MFSSKPKEDVRRKNWFIHDKVNRMTSIIRFVYKDHLDGNYVIAISRAFQSVFDNMFSRPIGRMHALNRMEKYFHKKYLKSNRSRRKEFKVEVQLPIDSSRERKKVIGFAIGGENLLNMHELEVWHAIILPQIERVL